VGIQNANPRPLIEELEDRLLGALGMPGADAEGGRSVAKSFSPIDLRPLNRLVLDLQREAALIGSIPQNYPRHVDLIMRGVSALLPWYTRPLREYGWKTSRAIASLAEVVNQLAVRQQELEETLLDRSNDPSEGRPRIL
jgi:hypothetical protein